MAFDALLEHGGWDAAVAAHAWFDPAADAAHDPPHARAAYRVPHHEVIAGQVRVVWRGVVAAMAMVNGSRRGGGVPESDRRRVYDHLASHYRQFHVEPPPFAQRPWPQRAPSGFRDRSRDRGGVPGTGDRRQASVRRQALAGR